MIELVSLTTLVCLALAGLVLALHQGTHMAGLGSRSLARSAAAVSLVVAALAGVSVLCWWLVVRGILNVQPWHLTLVLGAIVAPLASFVILRLVYRWTPREGVKGVVVLAVAAICVATLAFFPVGLVVRGFSIPTNGMAPTLRGRHLEGVCEHCGGPTVVSFVERDDERQFDPVSLEFRRAIEPADAGICTQCRRVGPAAQIGDQPRMGDRIVVSRLASPRRWDVIAFEVPFNQGQIYAKRLIGLPGETIHVRDDGIWIDGQPLAPPDDIAGLRWFLNEVDARFLETPYAVDEPFQLSDDEYFVMGDYSPKSYDSRFWGPVPADNVIGVVDAVYWPPRRWHALPRH